MRRKHRRKICITMCFTVSCFGIAESCMTCQQIALYAELRAPLYGYCHSGGTLWSITLARVSRGLSYDRTKDNDLFTQNLLCVSASIFMTSRSFFFFLNIVSSQRTPVVTDSWTVNMCVTEWRSNFQGRVSLSLLKRLASAGKPKTFSILLESWRRCVTAHCELSFIQTTITSRSQTLRKKHTSAVLNGCHQFSAFA